MVLLIIQEDMAWEWNRLFTEVSPDIQEVWDRLKGITGSLSKEAGGSVTDVT